MDKLKELEARPAGSLSDVVVIGGGYAGVELSAVVAEKLGDKGRVKVRCRGTMLIEWWSRRCLLSATVMQVQCLCNVSTS